MDQQGGGNEGQRPKDRPRPPAKGGGEGVGKGWNRAAADRASGPTDRGEQARDAVRPGGRQPGGRLAELAALLPEPHDPSTPGWLRPSMVTLRDGKTRMSAGEVEELRDLIQRVSDGSFQQWDEAVAKGPFLFLPNRDTHEIRWLKTGDLPQGACEVNNHWVYRRGNEVTAWQKYSEDPAAIKGQIEREPGPAQRKRLFQEEVSPKAVQDRLAAHRKLNGYVAGALQRGKSLEDAHAEMREQALLDLKIEIGKVAKLAWKAGHWEPSDIGGVSH